LLCCCCSRDCSSVYVYSCRRCFVRWSRFHHLGMDFGGGGSVTAAGPQRVLELTAERVEPSGAAFSPELRRQVDNEQIHQPLLPNVDPPTERPAAYYEWILSHAKRCVKAMRKTLGALNVTAKTRAELRDHLCAREEDLAVVSIRRGIGAVVCAPTSTCLDVDVEDFLAEAAAEMGAPDAVVQWQRWGEAREARLREAKPLTLVKRRGQPEVAACIEGPLVRGIDYLRLRRLAVALEGLGSEFRVVVVVTVPAFAGCSVGRKLYGKAFPGVLAKFVCFVDEAGKVVLRRFSRMAVNITWWRQNIRRFESGRAVDMLTLPTTLVNARMKSQCLDAIEAVERARGCAFRWLVYLRNDFDFFAAHPPLAAFGSVGGVWVPSGEDYSGINDRWAVVQRSFAGAYFRRWEAFVDGSIIPAFTSQNEIVPARVLLLNLELHGVWPLHVHRFLPTAALRCVAGSTYCHVDRRWRNILEWTDARNVATRLQRDGWRWNLTTGPRPMLPPCVASVVRRCCGLPPRDLDVCFDGLVSTHAYCCDRGPILSIALSPASAVPGRCWVVMPSYLFSVQADNVICAP